MGNMLFFEIECNQSSYSKLPGRILRYYNACQTATLQKEKECFLFSFFEKESEIERKIYSRMIKWEDRHPIMGIVLCTVLGAILLNLVSSCIFEAYIAVYR